MGCYNEVLVHDGCEEGQNEIEEEEEIDGPIPGPPDPALRVFEIEADSERDHDRYVDDHKVVDDVPKHLEP